MKPTKVTWIFVIAPFLVVLIYQMVLAARIYQSESRFVIRQIDQDAGMGNLGLPFLGPSSSSHQEDAVLLREYLISPNLLENLNAQVGLTAHYRKFGLDLLRHFPNNPSKEELLDAYRKMVSVQVLPEGGVVLLTVQAYDPETAQQLAGLITREGEAFINRISENMAREQVAFVEVEVGFAEKRLMEVRQQLLEFQNAQQVLNPEHQSETVIGLIAGLEAKLVEAKAERLRLLSFLKEGTPEVVTNQQQISSLEQQVLEEKSRLTGADRETLNRKLTEFKELQLEVEFALEAYKAGFALLEKAKLDASRKLKHFVMLSSTGLPEEASYPRVFYNLITALIVILLLYGIIRLVWATIQDHRI